MADISKGKYRKPRSINIVTIGLVLLLAAAIYWGWRFLPAYLDNYQVKRLLQEAAVKYYKLSFLERTTRSKESNALVQDTRKRIVDVLGFDDPQMTVQLLINEQSKKVNIVVEYDRPVFLPWLDKTRILHFRTVGESDYELVNW